MAEEAYIRGDTVLFDGEPVARVNPTALATLKDRFAAFLEGACDAGEEKKEKDWTEGVEAVQAALSKVAAQNAGLLTLQEVVTALEEKLK
jgi:hypothetical protein